MRIVIFLSLFIIIITSIIINGQEEPLFHAHHINNDDGDEPDIPIPFPQCFSTESAPAFLKPNVIDHIFDMKLKEEEKKLTEERDRNINLNNDDIMDFEEIHLRSDAHNGVLLARAATKAADELVYQLSCITNSSITHQLNTVLRKIQLPSDVCAFRPNPSCDGLTQYRTITGVCNNPRRPYQGSSQTAFGRLLPPAYEDGLRKPRSRSVLGGLLPPCRQISLSMGSKPTFDSTINNLWVTYGQFLVHDFTLSTPVTDSGRTPITSCTCSSRDTDMCTVINIAANDPFMSGQKCMAVPATAQSFSDQKCAFGYKEQMNGNSHYIDLSVTYGSTRLTAANIRTGFGGLMKTITQTGFKFELPPGQRDGRTCSDATETHRCFAGGDSRIMEHSVLASIQAQWLRMHNLFARELVNIHPEWRSDDKILYEESKKILSALHQHYTYNDWLPILIGKQTTEQYVGDTTLFTRYNPSVPGIVFNEAVTGVLRLHTFVRDLVSRCKPDGKLIDQLWFNDISSKAKFAYDTRTNGLDSFICGALHDFGFAGDSNYAQQIHHRLFESTNRQGETRRNDLVAINICRGREHGIPSYNAYREFCGFQRVNHFQDLSDTMGIEAIQKMQMIYKHPDDIDLFVGANHETHLPGAVVGAVSACIIGIQFQHLKYGDRFFYTHQGEFTLDQLNSIKKYSYNCFVCQSTDIERVARNPFRPPDDLTNPLEPCNQCPIFDFSPWITSTNSM